MEVQGLTKRYGERTAIEDVTFAVPKGQVMGFLGPNGAGKSTTIRILTGFIGATSGRASVAGYDVTTQSLEARRRTGYLPENAPLYEEMRVHAFLDFVCKLRGVAPSRRRSQVSSVLSDCGLEEHAADIIGHLSKGLRRRVGLAQAIVHEPELLILDEPAAGMDPAQARDMRDLIKRIGRDRTVILSSHVLSEVEAACERVVIIANGQITADGTPRRLAERFGGGKSHEIQITVRGEPAAVEEALRRIAGVDEVRLTGDDPEVVDAVVVTARSDLQETLTRELVEAGFGVQEVQSRTLSLEDVFLQATSGQSAR